MGAISTTFKINASAARSSLKAVHTWLDKIDRLNDKIGGTPIQMKITGVEALASTLSSANRSTKAIDSGMSSVANTTDRAARSAANLKKQHEKVSKELRTQHNFGAGIVRFLIRAWATLSGIRGIFMAINTGIDFFDKSMLMANKTATALRNTVGSMGSTGMAAAQVEMDKYYFAANRARTSYLEFANTASKFMIVAPTAFGDDNGAIRFTETLSKSLQLAGASAEEVNSVLLQVSQGLSSGYLQGEELRALRENGGMAAIALADYLGVTVGELKNLGAEGKITADVLVAALAAAEEDIDKHFANLPMTLSQQLALAGNYIRKSIEKTAKRIQDLMNTDSFKKFAAAAKKAWDAVVVAINLVINVIFNFLLPAFTAVVDGIEWLYSSNSKLASFLRGTLAAVLVATGLLFAWVGGKAVSAAIKAAGGWFMTMGVWGFVLLALFALIIGFAMIAQAAGFAGNFIEGILYAIGAIIGFVAALAVDIILLAVTAIIAVIFLIITAVLAVATVVIGIVGAVATGVYGIIVGAVALIIGVLSSIVRSFGAIASAASWVAQGLADAFVAGVNIAIRALNGLIETLNLIPGINIGTVGLMEAGSVGDWGAGATALADDMFNASQDVLGSIGDVASFWGDVTGSIGGLAADVGGQGASVVGSMLGDLQNPFDWGDAGGKTAIGIGNSIGDSISGMFPDGVEPPNENFLFEGNDGGTGGTDGGGGGGGAAGKIADDTNDIKNLLERMKDLAERNAVAKFTAVNVNIDMDNQIEQTDLDGVITYVTDKVSGAMNNSLAGVVL